MEYPVFEIIFHVMPDQKCYICSYEKCKTFCFRSGCESRIKYVPANHGDVYRAGNRLRNPDAETWIRTVLVPVLRYCDFQRHRTVRQHLLSGNRILSDGSCDGTHGFRPSYLFQHLDDRTLPEGRKPQVVSVLCTMR